MDYYGKIYKLIKYFLFLVTSLILMGFGYFSSVAGTGLNIILFYIKTLYWRFTGEYFDSIKPAILFQHIDNLIGMIGFVLFLYTVIKILLLLKEKD